MAQSSGEIRIFFTQSIDLSYSNGTQADGIGGSLIEQAIIDLIDNATQTVDFCVYNTSRDFIANALKAAHNRGVCVRVIVDDQAYNSAFLSSMPFPVMNGNPGSPLMHNKFIVIDAGIPQKAWVITGSMNLTYNNMFTDYNNVLFIQDQALAQAYTTEFEEMWGSSGPQPDYGQARYGADKTDNTPHQFDIGGMSVSCYFSPSDHTANRIIAALQAAQHDIQVAMWTFTYDELGDALVDAYHQGIDVRAIIDQGNEYDYLVGQGLNVTDHPPSPMIHHKYAIVDTQTPSDATAVITGSHNWTWSADNINDENTLILYDTDLANIFLQEFEARWHELVTATNEPIVRTFRCYPNPAIQVVWLDGLPEGPVSWALVHGNGQLVAAGRLPQSGNPQLDLPPVTSGPYWLLVRADNSWWRASLFIISQ